MYTKFYENTMITQFIKNVLSNTYIPMIKVWKPGDTAVKNSMYIVDGNIVRYSGDTSKVVSLENFDVLSPYIPEKSYSGINCRYVSNTNNYDPVTHKWLGEYLRFLRDYYSIDLMSFYNCYCGESPSGVDIVNARATNKPIDNSYKLFVVPVKFDTNYNIAIECDTDIEITYGFYGIKGVVDVDLFSIPYVKIPKCTLTSPYNMFKFDCPEQYSHMERYLRLFIKVPRYNTSSLVVIEGDISRTHTPEEINIYSNSRITCNSRDVLGNMIPLKDFYFIEEDGNARQSLLGIPIERCKSPLGLLQWNDKNTYAFSNRLIEYLLSNVITPIDTIDENTVRVQSYITLGSSRYVTVPPYRGSYSTGVWDENMRKYIYELRRTSSMSAKKNPNVDFNGYVDKDTEYMLTQGDM